MLEQKVHNSNERIRTQEGYLELLASAKHQGLPSTDLHANDGESTTGSKKTLAWSNNATFLHDMVQQVQTPLSSFAIHLCY